MSQTLLRKIGTLTVLAAVLLGILFSPLTTRSVAAYAAWAPNTAYAVGALVTYNAVDYKAIQAHTSQVGWEPPNVPALWQNIGSGGGGPTATQTNTPTPTRTNTPTATPPPGGNGNPFGGSPRAVPGTIQAEDFNTGGEGVAYHDADTTNSGGQYRTSEAVDIQITSDNGAGFNVGWVRAGEWLKYLHEAQC